MRSSKPLFSIVVPCLNEEKYLPHLLNDLVKQARPPLFQVLVVDARSEDKTQMVAKTYSQKLNLKLVISHRRNLSYQRNLGAKRASGDYLIFIDADCRLPKNFLHKAEEAVKETKSLILIPRLMEKTGSSIDDLLVKLTNYFIPFSQYIGCPFTPGACLIFERDFFFHINGFKVDRKQDQAKLFPEDIDFMLRARKAGVSANYLKEVEFRFSFRRFKRSGRLTVMRKYLIGAMEMIINKKADSLSVSYPMGGHHYVDYYDRKKTLSVDQVKTYIETIKKQMNNFFLGNGKKRRLKDK